MKTKENNKMRNLNTLKLVAFSLFAMMILVGSVNALTLVSPTSQTVAENSTLNFGLVAENYSGTVTYAMSSQKGTLTKINDSTAQYSWTPGFSDSGTYTITFNATDSNSTATSQTIITVSNTNKPINILSKTNPGTISTSTTQINITTDKPSNCRFDVDDKDYSSMQYTFTNSNTENTTHYATTPSLAQGAHTLYLQCEDSEQNHLTTTDTINYTINLKPTASITIDPSSPVKAETITVHLTTSEDLTDTPQLNYYFDDDTNPRSITLIGSGHSWEGYIIIKDAGYNRIGTFTFKGTDTTGLEGTEITSGKIFMIDTKKPDTVRSIEAVNQDSGIKLIWDYASSSGTRIKEYHIYRKVGSGRTDYVDYYDKTSNEYYYDNDVDYNQAYYYKITAVDDAGNEGDLSKEVYVVHKPILTQNTTTAPIITTTSVTKLNSRLVYQLSLVQKSVDKTLMDISEVESKIGKATGTDKITAIQALGLLSKIKEQKNIMITAQNNLKDLLNYDITQSEFDKRTEQILQNVNNAWKNTPQDITIIDSSNYKEAVNDQKTKDATNIYISNKNITISSGKLASLIDQNKKLQDSLSIDSTVIKSKVTYPEKSETYITVQKIISSDNPLDKVGIVEIIPKGLANNTDNILFSDAPKMLQKDPVVLWDVDTLTKKTLTYSVQSNTDIVNAKTVKSVVINENMDRYLPSGLTGMTTGGDSGSGNPYFIPLLIGILVAVALASYYLFSTEDKDSSESKFTKKIFDFKSVLKSKKENIMPEGYGDEKKLSFEHLATQNKDFLHTTSSSGTASLIVANQQPIQSTTEPPNEKINEIQRIYDLLADYNKESSEHKNLELSDLQFIQKNTVLMRTLLDEIEKKNLEAYTDKAKETLKHALMYMTRADATEEIKPITNNLSNTKKSKKMKSKSQKRPDNRNKYLVECDKDKEFVLSNGVKLKSIKQLIDYSDFMDDSTFRHHVNDSRNDFSTWIKDVFKDTKLANKLLKVKSKEELKKILKK